MRAGSRGRRIDDISNGWDVAEKYGVITDFDHTGEFLGTLADQPEATHAYIVTDDDWIFESVCRDLPERIEPVRLYEAYLRNFELEAGRGAR
jgi:adenine-specific DNA-methyltransferase